MSNVGAADLAPALHLGSPMTDILTRLSTALADCYRIERELGAGGVATGKVARSPAVEG